MKEVGSLEGVHRSQFSYSLLCKSLKFYIKPWFFLMVIYAIAIINMYVFAHAFSRSGVPGHRSSGSDFIPCSSQGKDQWGSEICQFIQHCSNLRAWVNSSWLSRPLEWELLWRNISSALRLSAASIIWSSLFLVQIPVTVLCSTAHSERGAYKVRSQREAKNVAKYFPLEFSPEKAQETLFFTFLSVILFPFHCYILKLPK